MNRPLTVCIAFATLLIAPFLAAQTQPQSKTASQAAKSAASPAAAQQHDDGGKKFDQNCSRCHNVPERMPASVSGTIVRHMRIRANLSPQDEKDILRFLAP